MYNTLHSAATSDSLAAYEACFRVPPLLDSGRPPSALILNGLGRPILPSDLAVDDWNYRLLTGAARMMGPWPSSSQDWKEYMFNRHSGKDSK